MPGEYINIYKAARQRTGFTQEQAAEALILSVESIRAYETGQRAPNPSIVVEMADTYQTPELLNQFCTGDCPIGCRCQQRLELAELDRLTVRLLSAWRSGDAMKNLLLDITEDGIIEQEERPQLKKILTYLDSVSKIAAELKLWAERTLADG